LDDLIRYDFSRKVLYHYKIIVYCSDRNHGEVPERLNGAVSFAPANPPEEEKPLWGSKCKDLSMC
jgi:hypothetical protein